MFKPIILAASTFTFLIINNCTNGSSNQTHSEKPVKEIVSSNSDEQKAAQTAIVSHDAFNSLLKAYVADNGRVNYKGFVKDKAKLQTYITNLGKTDASKLSKNEQLAYWANAYNAATVDQIVRNYPIKSIQNIAGGKVWDKPLPYKFNGKTLTLNQIEKQKLIEELADPRIHFIINCAAISCPKLANIVYTADNIQAMMASQTKSFLNNETFNKLTKEKAVISNIFNWYKADFSMNGSSVVDFINKYATTKISSKTTLDYMNYNWDLNEK